MSREMGFKNMVAIAYDVPRLVGFSLSYLLIGLFTHLLIFFLLLIDY